MSLSYVTIHRRSDGQNLQLRVLIPVKYRAEFMRNPAIVKLGIKLDVRGRYRCTMGRLPMREVRAIAERWDKMLCELAARRIDEDFTAALRIVQKNNR